MSKCKKLPEWDLSEYYNGVDDPQIQKDLDLFDKKAKPRNFVLGLALLNIIVFPFLLDLNF